jgi:diguanylate cyclase (GGDEF)-like protein
MEEKQWTLVEAALAISRPLGAVGALFGLLALAGYSFGIEALYRPFAGWPATHPLSAVSILFLGLGISANDRTPRGIWLQRLCAFLAGSIAAIRLCEAIFGVDLTSSFTPFHDMVLFDQGLGRKNSMGVNTACMLFSIALALGLQSARMPRTSQLVASIAVAIPVVSFTGYAYGLERFHGQMSLLTATAGFGLACGTLAKTADHAGLRAILSPYIGGKIARAQVIAGYLIPTGLGYMLVRSFVAGSGQSQSLFGVFVVAICWFIIMMVSVSAIFHERVDFERRQSEARLAAAAVTDSLTGLPNRRRFFEWGQHEVERIRRNGSEGWALMIDLDHFKNINDTAGHAIGDKVLTAVAQLLLQSIRKVDLVGRLGGEEFAVLLVDTNKRGCEHVAENIRANIEALHVPGWTDIHGPVTASIGCARLHGTETMEGALQAADEALYCAKKNGRNRVVFAEETRNSTEMPNPDISNAGV